MGSLCFRSIALSTLVSAAALAAPGSIEILGHGDASSPPQFASVTVSVTSICYDTARDAKNANALLANRILDVMKQFKRGERDRVTATGGPSERRTEYSDPQQRVILCERKWRSENNLTLETSALTALDEIQEALLKVMDSEEVNPSIKSQSFANLSRFGFHVYPETESKMRIEAQSKAWLDAKAQYEGFLRICNFKEPKLSQITPPTVYSRPEVFQQAAKSHSFGTPIIPRDLRTEVQWRFVWTFEPTTGCALLAP